VETGNIRTNFRASYDCSAKAKTAMQVFAGYDPTEILQRDSIAPNTRRWSLASGP
jgi:hypothetical protein